MDKKTFELFDTDTIIAIVKQNRFNEATRAINAAFGFRSDYARAAQAASRSFNEEADRICNNFHDQNLMETYRDEVYVFFKKNISLYIDIDRAAKCEPPKLND